MLSCTKVVLGRDLKRSVIKQVIIGEPRKITLLIFLTCNISPYSHLLFTQFIMGVQKRKRHGFKLGVAKCAAELKNNSKSAI